MKSPSFRFVVGILFSLFSCSSPPDTLFTEMRPEDTGIDFVNVNRETEEDNILTYEYFYNGAGVAAGDINNDGLVDLFFTSNQGENKLYLNRGDFRFEDITTSAGLADKTGWRTGASMADVNGDGLLDIYVCRSGNQHEMLRYNSLYINKGNLTFEDQASSFGLNDKSYTTQAAFFDFDNDRDLDVFLLNHSRLTISNSYDVTRRYLEKRVPFVGNRLLKNDEGKFVDVSDSLGVFGPASNYGLGVVMADFNNDGSTDVYTSNDYTEKDKLLLNTNFRFQDVSDSSFSHMSQFSMGVDAADVNNDGYVDLVTLDMLPETNLRQKEFFWPDKYDVYAAMVRSGRHHQYMRNMLHVNNGDGSFRETGQFARISNTDWSWAPLLADFDNDGWQDLLITNGFKRNFTSNDFLRYQADLSLKAQRGEVVESMSEILMRMPQNATHDYVFKNIEGNRFMDMSASWGFQDETLSSGAAYADLDNDGDLDLIISRIDATAGVYRNNSEVLFKNHFMKVRLNGLGKNVHGVGARVSVHADSLHLVRELFPVRGFQSSVEHTLFFGLGKHTEIDSMVVSWPGGKRQRIINPKVDQLLNLSEREASDIKYSKDPTQSRRRFLPFQHKENEYIDFKVQSLLPRMYSTQGPALAVSAEDKNATRYLYAGGAKGQAGVLFLIDEGGKHRQIQTFNGEKNSEDIDAVFFDFDNDKDEDLYVVTGGYEYDIDSSDLQDHLYENSQGTFRKIELPDLKASGSCVKPIDFDRDGDLDLFVGSRLVPGRYPEVPESYLLENDGKGKFNVNSKWMEEGNNKLGLVSDAEWTDVNNDGFTDLVVVGEWMPITIFIQENAKLVDRTTQYISESTEGWWNCVTVGDVDGDGDSDLLAGNFGMNSQLKADQVKPVQLVYDDFDKNGSIDLIHNYFIAGKPYPMPTRDELTDQMPSFRKRFPDYHRYATATVETILTTEEIKNARILYARCFETSLFINNGKGFTRVSMPYPTQLAPVFDIATFQSGAEPGMLIGGNLSAMGARLGKATGLNLEYLTFSGGKAHNQKGLPIKGDVRKIVVVDSDAYIAFNNGRIEIISLADLPR